MAALDDLWHEYLSVKMPRGAPTVEIVHSKHSVLVWAPGPAFSAMPRSVSRNAPGGKKSATAVARREWLQNALPPGSGDFEWPPLCSDEEIASPATRAAGLGSTQLDITLRSLATSLAEAARATDTLARMQAFRDTASDEAITATNTEIVALKNAVEDCIPLAPAGLDLGRLAKPAPAPSVTARPDVAFDANVLKIFQLHAGEVREKMDDPGAADTTVKWVIQWALRQSQHDRITPAAAAAFASETGLYKACIVTGFLSGLKKQIRDYARQRKSRPSRYIER